MSALEIIGEMHWIYILLTIFLGSVCFFSLYFLFQRRRSDLKYACVLFGIPYPILAVISLFYLDMLGPPLWISIVGFHCFLFGWYGVSIGICQIFAKKMLRRFSAGGILLLSSVMVFLGMNFVNKNIPLKERTRRINLIGAPSWVVLTEEGT